MKPFIVAIAASLLVAGCDKEFDIDTTPPPPPQGITTISLDNAVEIRWLESQAEDIKGYNVWVSDQCDGHYTLIASVTTPYFVDQGAVNGTTYYYAVSAYDYNDNESELSKDVICDTPRPEGHGLWLSDYRAHPGSSGYDFSEFFVLSYNNIQADFFFENSNGRFSLDVWNDTDIQDMGYTSSLDEISFSPFEGWAPSKSAEAISGHTYIIWTWDDHYAKVRVTDVGADRIVFDWAYQTAERNPELRIVRLSPIERRPLERTSPLE